MKRVLVGMSGGVDSSAAAVLLLEQGYEVCGCTVKMFDAGSAANDDISDAAAVCRRLGTEHITLDFSEDFEKCVMQPFAKSYISGETPNPCIDCNREIKFGLMLDFALSCGFDFIATGHYARVECENGRWQLMRSADRTKDQTYVLYPLTQHMLAHTLFPLFGKEKREIREIAQKNGLVNSRKRESQDICFIPDKDYRAFIGNYMSFTPKCGDFIDTHRNVIGRHTGVINYTIGQRKGLGIALGKPAYVVAKDARRNTVTLSESPLEADYADISNVNLIPFDSLAEPMKVTAKVRYGALEQPAVIYPADERGIIRVRFESPVKNPAPGQACVFYSGDRVVGGGRIIGAGKE